MGQFQLSSARVTTTCRIINSHENMNGFKTFCLFALVAGGASAAGPNRRGKNLRGTFPFNQRNAQAASHAAHDHHHEHAHAHNAVDARASRQGGGDDVALDIGSIAAAGERCIDKVVMVEETEYDDVIECKHSYSQKCEDVTQGYTTEKKCTKWPKQVCTSAKANVKKYSPETECKKVPKELCGPSGCELKPGPEECFPRTETVVTEVPEETCNLEPQKEC